MVGVRRGLAAYVVALGGLLALLGVGAAGWLTGLACGAGLAVAAARQAACDEVTVLGPADLVTVTRATLACAVAALVAEPPDAAGLLVVLAVVALALDFVDGRVARRTGTASSFGARLDGEADAFLILVLSVHVAREAGWWVLALGAIRYAYAVATWLLPWMQQKLPFRYWRKVVAAYVGIALVVASTDVVPSDVEVGGLLVAAALLAESFGWDVVWLWRRRGVNRARPDDVRRGKTLEQNR